MGLARNPWKRFRAWYFSPRPFERWRDGRAYELIGVHKFKRFLPTSGDLVSRWRGKRWVSWLGHRTVESLIAHERRTRNWEARHIFGLVSMLALSWWSIEVKGKGSWAALLAANLLINGYPILLQRYNRVRLEAAMTRLAHRSESVEAHSAACRGASRHGRFQ